MSAHCRRREWRGDERRTSYVRISVANSVCGFIGPGSRVLQWVVHLAPAHGEAPRGPGLPDCTGLTPHQEGDRVDFGMHPYHPS